MSLAAGPIDEAELHAYVDGRLAADRRAAVAEWLETHPEERRRIADWQRQNELIGRLWAEIAEEPVPERLRVERLRRHGLRRRLAAVAAALLLLAAGASAGWLARGASPRAADPVTAIAGAGLEAHRMFVAERRHAVEVPREEEQHLVAWLSNRLERPLRAPDLGAFGLQLLGGRLLPMPGGEPAAQLMYEDPDGARFTLFIARGEGRDPAFRILEAEGVSAFYWLDRDTAYALIGTAPRERLMAICQAVYAQLESGPG